MPYKLVSAMTAMAALVPSPCAGPHFHHSPHFLDLTPCEQVAAMTAVAEAAAKARSDTLGSNSTLDATLTA